MKVAVILYLYNSALLSEYISLLAPIKKDIHLFIGVCLDNEADIFLIEKTLMSNHIDYTLSTHHNIGLDIGPFLQQIQTVDSSKYKTFIKLHSKQSLWGYYKNIPWRIPLVNSLIGSDIIFKTNRQHIQNNKHVGMIANTGFMLGRDKEGRNSNIIKDICTNFLSINIEEINRTDISFVAGSIFWSHTEIFQKYFTPSVIHKLYSLLESKRFNDSKQGTYAHSLERIFGYIIGLSGYHIIDGFVDKTIDITNTKSNYSYKLIQCYNKVCYVDIDVLTAGIHYHIGDSLLINWKHKSYNGFWKKYHKITDLSYIS
jgi:rhamnosyltransferase